MITINLLPLLAVTLRQRLRDDRKRGSNQLHYDPLFLQVDSLSFHLVQISPVTSAALIEQLGFAPVQLGKLAEGGLLVQARGKSWAQLIFQDFVKFK